MKQPILDKVRSKNLSVSELLRQAQVLRWLYHYELAEIYEAEAEAKQLQQQQHGVFHRVVTQIQGVMA